MLYAFCRRIVRIMRIYSHNLHSLHQLHSSAKKKFWPMGRMKRMYFHRLTHTIRRKSIETTAADVEYIGSRIVCCHRMMYAFPVREYARKRLSVDHLSVLILVGSKVFAVLVHRPQAHAHVGEPAVVEECLHGHLAREVAEHHHAIVGTLVG